jgi:hypothetical protein
VTEMSGSESAPARPFPGIRVSGLGMVTREDELSGATLPYPTMTIRLSSVATEVVSGGGSRARGQGAIRSPNGDARRAGRADPARRVRAQAGRTTPTLPAGSVLRGRSCNVRRVSVWHDAKNSVRSARAARELLHGLRFAQWVSRIVARSLSSCREGSA